MTPKGYEAKKTELHRSPVGDMSDWPHRDEDSWVVLRRGSGPESIGRSDISTEDLALIRRFAPDYLLLAEGRPGDQPPHPAGRSDYHPRQVELFTDHATMAWIGASPQGSRLALPLVVLLTGLIFVVMRSLSISLSATSPLEGMLVGYAAALLTDPLNVAIVAMTVLAARFVIRMEATSARGTDSIRAALGGSLPGGLRQRVMSVPGQGSGIEGALIAWETYCRTVVPADADYPRTVYARIVRGPGGTSLALQFWTYYYFNHFVDMHESDWECVLLFFANGASVPGEPSEAAYSSHIGTIWRAWVDVPKRLAEDEAHPIVYVARGSHAQYFGSCPGGYHVQGALGAYASYYPSPWNRIIRGSYSRATRDLPQEAMREARDYVPNVTPDEAASAVGERTADYEVVAMPTDLGLVDPSGDSALWKRFWWLRYNGSWGRPNLQLGPQRQHRRWEWATSWAGDTGRLPARDASSDRHDAGGYTDCPEADLVPDDTIWPPRIES